MNFRWGRSLLIRPSWMRKESDLRERWFWLCNSSNILWRKTRSVHSRSRKACSWIGLGGSQTVDARCFPHGGRTREQYRGWNQAGLVASWIRRGFLNWYFYSTFLDLSRSRKWFHCAKTEGCWMSVEEELNWTITEANVFLWMDLNWYNFLFYFFWCHLFNV